MRAIGSMLLILGLSIGAVWLGARSSQPSTSGHLDVSRALEELPRSKQFDALAAEADAQKKLTQTAISAELEATIRLAKDAIEERRKWDAEIVPLLRNDAGRALTKRPEWIEQFAAIFSEPRPSADALALTLKKAESAQNAGVELTLSGAERSDLTNGRAAAEAGARSYRTGRERIATLVGRAVSSPLVPAAGILEDEITRRIPRS